MFALSRVKRFVFIGLVMLCCGRSVAADGSVLRLGVLAFQGKAVAEKQWTATAEHLTVALKPRRVELFALTYDEINAAIAEGKIDLVLTNPEHYVALQRAFGVRPLVTLVSRIDGKPYETFGGVMFTRVGTGIRRLEDIRGQKVAAVGLFSLGGFLAQARELNRIGVDLRSRDVASLRFTGVPHDLVVQAVLKEEADVGMVRAGVLEAMASRGELDLNKIRVIHPNTHDPFPYRLSTQLYPEWPLAVLPHVPGLLAKDIMQAAMQIAPDDAAAATGRYHGFAPVADYSPVADLMSELRIVPKVDKRRLWVDLWEEHQVPIVAGLSGVTGLLLVLIGYLVVQVRRQRSLTALYEKSQADIGVTATAFNSPVGLIVTDQASRILKANEAVCDLLGCAESDLLGHTTRSIRFEGTPPRTIAQMWSQLQADGVWRGEMACRHASGHAIPCMVSIRAVTLLGQSSGFVASFTDLSEQKQAEHDMRRLAYFDSLTQLPNRRMFLEELQQAAARSAPGGGALGALICIDLDHFKLLNDTHGHDFGDQLLVLLADRLGHVLPESALLARLGGDEFVVLVREMPAEADTALDMAMALADRLHDVMLQPVPLHISDEPTAGSGIIYHCTGSVGVTLFGPQAETPADILKRADLAMYQAKHAGRNAVRAFDRSVQLATLRRGVLSADLSGALLRGELSAHFQLQTNASGQPVGAEMLMRWFHPVHGQVSPAEFIPLAEESGAIVDMGEWGLVTACRTLADWSRQPGFESLTLSVNISPRQFTETDFATRLAAVLGSTGAPADKLVLEVTEGIVMANADEVIATMLQVCELGVSFSVDDFGTGYSSLSYLQRLPLREVKIDKAFVGDMMYNSGSEAIVRAILALAHSLGLVVVSEGVETPEQHHMLARMGCDEFQGYLLGRPAMLATFEAHVRARLTG